METFADSIIDFIAVRQLNFLVAGLLTLVYLVYQYWGALFPSRCLGDEDLYPGRMSRSRSNSKSRSRVNYDHKSPEKQSRRGRKSYRRCPDCGHCDYD